METGQWIITILTFIIVTLVGTRAFLLISNAMAFRRHRNRVVDERKRYMEKEIADYEKDKRRVITHIPAEVVAQADGMVEGVRADVESGLEKMAKLNSFNNKGKGSLCLAQMQREIGETIRGINRPVTLLWESLLKDKEEAQRTLQEQQ